MVYVTVFFCICIVYVLYFIYKCYLHAKLILEKKPIREYYHDKAVDIEFCHLKDISEHVLKLIIIMEDPKFYRHHGFDCISILRAIKFDILNCGFKKGASTITQQLARNMYLSFEKTIFRKVVEMFIAIRLEQELTKEEILELYLNIIDYGNNCYGIKPASELYFKKIPSMLDFDESLIICALLPAPSKYNPLSKYKQLPIKLARDRENLRRLGIIHE